VDYPQKLKTLSLCSGYGGIERGLELAGIRVTPVAYVEIEAFAIANLVDKMEKSLMGAAPIWTDIKTLNGRTFRGMVDLITGGFPCQPFSAAGNKNADSDPRHLFPYIKKLITTIRPRIVFLENVDGIASSRLKGDGWADPAGTPVLLHVLRELERMGYKATAGCYSAAEMGASQKRRRRWFIMGHSVNTGLERHTWDGSGNRNIRKIPGQGGQSTQTSLQECWPMPPGPRQWEWEASRTVVCTAGQRLQGRGSKKSGGPEKNQKLKRSDECEKRKTKPRLGGAINGATSGVDPNRNRIDRLRLLGNGVVPQTAGRAFLELFTKLSD